MSDDGGLFQNDVALSDDAFVSDDDCKRGADAEAMMSNVADDSSMIIEPLSSLKKNAFALNHRCATSMVLVKRRDVVAAAQGPIILFF